MSVLVEAISVIVRRSTLEQKYPGGLAQYQRNCPNRTFCADDTLTRIGFMAPEEAQAWIDHLQLHGLVNLRGDTSIDVAIVHQVEGFLGLCDWLEGGIDESGIGRVWLKGTAPGPLAVPPHWASQQSRGMTYVTPAEAESRIMPLGPANGVEAFLDLKSGKVVYAPGARPTDRPELQDQTETLQAQPSNSIGRYLNWMHKSPTWREWEGACGPVAAIVTMFATGWLLHRAIRTADISPLGEAFASTLLGIVGLVVVWPALAISAIMLARVVAGLLDRFHSPSDTRLD